MLSMVSTGACLEYEPDGNLKPNQQGDALAVEREPLRSDTSVKISKASTPLWVLRSELTPASTQIKC